jgi:hypothetical protein
MSRRRTVVARFLEADPPTLAVATSALRLVFLGLFGAQVVIALAIGFALASLVPTRSAANDVFAVVLLVMAALHLPLAWVLAHAAKRSGGKQAALSSTVLSGVLSSVPAWFATLMLISGQRPIYLLLIMVLLSVAYALGFVSAGQAAVVATRPPTASPSPDAPS